MHNASLTHSAARSPIGAPHHIPKPSPTSARRPMAIRSPAKRESSGAREVSEKRRESPTTSKVPWGSSASPPSKSSNHRARNYGRARQAAVEASIRAQRMEGLTESPNSTYAAGSPAMALRSALQTALVRSSTPSRGASRHRGSARAAARKSQKKGLNRRQPRGSSVARATPPRPSSARAMRLKLQRGTAQPAAFSGRLSASPYKTPSAPPQY